MSLALYMEIRLLGAAGMMMMGVFEGLLPGVLDEGFFGAGLLLGADLLLLAGLFPSVTLFKVMPEKVPVVSMLNP